MAAPRHVERRHFVCGDACLAEHQAARVEGLIVPAIGQSQPCTCREIRPCWSDSVFVLVEEFAETVMATDA